MNWFNLVVYLQEHFGIQFVPPPLPIYEALNPSINTSYFSSLASVVAGTLHRQAGQPVIHVQFQTPGYHGLFSGESNNNKIVSFSCELSNSDLSRLWYKEMIYAEVSRVMTEYIRENENRNSKIKEVKDDNA